MNIRSILVPVDFSNAAHATVAFAQGIAEAFKARVSLLHITERQPDIVGLEPIPPTPGVLPEPDFRTEHRQLQELRQPLTAAGLETIVVALRGNVRDKILQEAAAQSADLIVIGSHGHGALYHLLVGSVAAGLLKHAPCPVLVVPAPPAEPILPPAEEPTV